MTLEYDVMKESWMKRGLVISVILLFIGVAVAPSIHVAVAKEGARHKIVDSVVGSSRVSRNNLVTLVNAYKKDGPWLWLFFRILEILGNILKTINYVIDLIREGKFLSETIRGFCMILLLPLLIIAQYRYIIYYELKDFVPWTWEDTLLYRIIFFLGNIVFPNQVIYRNFHLFVNNGISTGVLMEEG
jgi:hypothetical protein